MGCGCVILLIFSCIFSLACLVIRPDFAVDPLIDFLNNGRFITKSEATNEVSSDETKQFIQDQIKNNGKNEIIITQEQVNSIAKQNLKNLDDLQVDLKEDEIELLWSLKEIKKGKDVLGHAILKVEDDSIVIKKLGTPKFALPSTVEEFLASSILATTKLGKDTSSAKNVTTELLGFKDSIRVDDIKIEENRIIITVDVTVKIYD